MPPCVRLLASPCRYVRYRYGEAAATDGCVARRDAVLPGCPVVWLDDMDHHGPAWRGGVAADAYDPARVCLALVSLALDHGAGDGSAATAGGVCGTADGPAASAAASMRRPRSFADVAGTIAGWVSGGEAEASEYASESGIESGSEGPARFKKKSS